jgi:hypothetical protein
MVTVLNFQGVIRNLTYHPSVRKGLLRTFDIDSIAFNRSYGLIRKGDIQIGFSTWVSPKRTRSYPFARLYNIYHVPKRITIIPIIKDEGLRGDCDRINAITLSWMNLANVFIVLAYYDNASAGKEGKITKQQFNLAHVRAYVNEIWDYQQTALHWNTLHFERDYRDIFLKAVRRYKELSLQLGVPLHNSSDHLKTLAKYCEADQFKLELFRKKSLESSRLAMINESVTQHRHEFLQEGAKGLFTLRNYLGGEYYLTADEVYLVDDIVIIQESKNATKGKLPKLADIQDGLFKLILFANLDELTLNDVARSFRVRLKLTGPLQGVLQLPATIDEILKFGFFNNLSTSETKLLEMLNQEVAMNPKLHITISPNS